MADVFLGLGSNLGGRGGQLARALSGLGCVGSLRRVSSLYETDPLGGPPQPPYLNAVVWLVTARSPWDLLVDIRRLEQAAGRIRREHWGPRPLDLDILWYHGQSIQMESLRVPHPEARRRRFVLVPWVEVWPDGLLDGTPLVTWLRQSPGPEPVRLADARYSAWGSRV